MCLIYCVSFFFLLISTKSKINKQRNLKYKPNCCCFSASFFFFWNLPDIFCKSTALLLLYVYALDLKACCCLAIVVIFVLVNSFISSEIVRLRKCSTTFVLCPRLCDRSLLSNNNLSIMAWHGTESLTAHQLAGRPAGLSFMTFSCPQ